MNWWDISVKAGNAGNNYKIRIKIHPLPIGF